MVYLWAREGGEGEDVGVRRGTGRGEAEGVEEGRGEVEGEDRNHPWVGEGEGEEGMVV